MVTRFLVLLIFIALMGGCSEGNGPDPTQARLGDNSSTTIELNLGEIPYGTMRRFETTLLNDTSKPRTIRSISQSCGCTTLENPQEMFLAGKRTYLKGKLTATRLDREVNEVIQISLDDGSSISLRVKATVVFIFDPNIDLGVIGEGERPMKVIQLPSMYSKGGVRRLDYPSRFLDVTHDMLQDGGVEFRVAPAAEMRSGSFAAQIRGEVEGADGVIRQFSSSVSGVKKPMIAVDPPEIVVPQLERNAPTTAFDVSCTVTAQKGELGDLALSCTEEIAILGVPIVRKVGPSASNVSMRCAWRGGSGVGIITIDASAQNKRATLRVINNGRD